MSGNRPKKFAIFISGNGSTLQALLEMQHQILITLVVTNKRHTLGQLKAMRWGGKTLFLSKHCSYEELTKKLLFYNIDHIFLAGYMKLLPDTFVLQWENKIFNIHPSLLPYFPGLNSAEKNFLAKQKMGVTIHSVTTEMDQGPIFLQQSSAAEKQVCEMNLKEAQFLLRRTEQHILREFVLRKAI